MLPKLAPVTRDEYTRKSATLAIINRKLAAYLCVSALRSQVGRVQRHYIPGWCCSVCGMAPRRAAILSDFVLQPDFKAVDVASVRLCSLYALTTSLDRIEEVTVLGVQYLCYEKFSYVSFWTPIQCMSVCVFHSHNIGSSPPNAYG